MFRLDFGHQTLLRDDIALPASQLDVQGWEREVLAFAQQWQDMPETITVNTSGSTGTPKPIALHTLSMRKSAQITNSFFKLRPKCRGLLCLPVQYIAGKMMVVRAMEGDWDLHCVEPSLTPLPKEHSGYDFVAMTPLQVERQLEADVKSFDKVKTVIVGGAPVHFQLRKKLQKLKTAFLATYGMTETCTHVAVQRLNGPKQTDYFEALPGYVLRRDSYNCLTISYDHLVGEVIVTNDRVDIPEPGKFFWIGRTDSAINSAGVKVFPEHIERQLEPYLEMPFYISSQKDPSFAEKVVLVLEGPPWLAHDLTELIKDLKSILGRFEVPQEIMFVDVFERTPTGKIKRQKY